jgi:hypothetical protein
MVTLKQLWQSRISRRHRDRFVAISDVQASAQQHWCEEQRVVVQIPVRQLIEQLGQGDAVGRGEHQVLGGQEAGQPFVIEAQPSLVDPHQL